MTKRRHAVWLGVTYGVTSTGNLRALVPSLFSILLGEFLPSRLLIRLEGEMPSFADFYLEQVAELARAKYVEFTLQVAESGGIRSARDWLVDNCKTRYLWMGDDDVIYDPQCLAELEKSVQETTAKYKTERIGFINGAKVDLNNRRGYSDFSKRAKLARELRDGSPTCFRYQGPSRTVRCSYMDTGNVLIDCENVRAEKIRFNMFDFNYNSVGSDTLFGLLCTHRKLLGYFRSGAMSYHLEKPSGGLSEFAARKNILLRECELLGIPPIAVVSLMPWVK
jgi:hypothetical protein